MVPLPIADRDREELSPGQGADAARLIGLDAAGQAGVDMGHPLRPAAVLGGVEIGVEDAGAAELELDPRTLAHLEGRLAEALAELAGGHAEKVAADVRRDLGRRRRPGGGRRLDRGSWGAGGDGKQGEKDQTTHRKGMAVEARPGKLAATRRAR